MHSCSDEAPSCRFQLTPQTPDSTKLKTAHIMSFCHFWDPETLDLLVVLIA